MLICSNSARNSAFNWNGVDRWTDRLTYWWTNTVSCLHGKENVQFQQEQEEHKTMPFERWLRTSARAVSERIWWLIVSDLLNVNGYRVHETNYRTLWLKFIVCFKAVKWSWNAVLPKCSFTKTWWFHLRLALLNGEFSTNLFGMVLQSSVAFPPYWTNQHKIGQTINNRCSNWNVTNHVD